MLIATSTKIKIIKSTVLIAGSCADPEGGIGGLDPLENHKFYGFLYK